MRLLVDNRGSSASWAITRTSKERLNHLGPLSNRREWGPSHANAAIGLKRHGGSDDERPRTATAGTRATIFPLIATGGPQAGGTAPRKQRPKSHPGLLGKSVVSAGAPYCNDRVPSPLGAGRGQAGFGRATKCNRDYRR